MDARKKEIDVFEADIRRLEHQITSECVEVGRRIAALAPADVRTLELARYLASAATLRRALDASRADIDRIRELGRHTEALGRDIDTNARRRDSVLRERQSKFSELGVASFARFKSLPARDPYRAVFDELLKIDLEAESRLTELRQIEAGEKGRGLLDKLKSTARRVLLRGELSRLEKARVEAAVAAAPRIAETDFERHAEGPLRSLFESAREKKAAADAFSVDSDRKLEEMESCRQELKRLDAAERPDDRIRDLEKRIETLVKELEVTHGWTGQLFLDRDLRAEIDDDGLSARHAAVIGLQDSIRKKKQQIDRLKAETEMEDIGRREKERRARRHQIEEELRVKERQIGVIDLEINLGLKRIEELRRVVAGEIPYAESPPFPPMPDLYPPSPPKETG